MAFRFNSESTGSRENSLSPLRTIKSPKQLQTRTYSGQPQFNIPCGQNWVYASGSSRPIRFDFAKALDEKIASEDETCGSSQEYYARKSASSSSNHDNRNFVPPTLPTYKPDPRFMYPTQRPNYTFNFDRATPADVEIMNTALPFGSTSFTERKQKTRKDIKKVDCLSIPKHGSFDFGNRNTNFSPDISMSSTRTTVSTRTGSTMLTVRSQNHDGNFRRDRVAKPPTPMTK